MRVGILACNCYQWINYDLALLELRAQSVAFTDDFAGMSADELLDKYSLSLLLIQQSDHVHRESRSVAVAFIDAENSGIQAIERPRGKIDWEFNNTGIVFSSGSSGRLKGLTLSRAASRPVLTHSRIPRNPGLTIGFCFSFPISNFQQRLMYYSALWYGFDLIVTDPPRLFRVSKDLHPTILIAPPMLYEAFENRFYSLPGSNRQQKSLARSQPHCLQNRCGIRSAERSSKMPTKR